MSNPGSMTVSCGHTGDGGSPELHERRRQLARRVRLRPRHVAGPRGPAGRGRGQAGHDGVSSHGGRLSRAASASLPLDTATAAGALLLPAISRQRTLLIRRPTRLRPNENSRGLRRNCQDCLRASARNRGDARVPRHGTTVAIHPRMRSQRSLVVVGLLFVFASACSSSSNGGGTGGMGAAGHGAGGNGTGGGGPGGGSAGGAAGMDAGNADGAAGGAGGAHDASTGDATDASGDGPLSCNTVTHCPAGQTCIMGGTCAQSCTIDGGTDASDACPAGTTCQYATMASARAQPARQSRSSSAANRRRSPATATPALAADQNIKFAVPARAEVDGTSTASSSVVLLSCLGVP